MHKQSSRNHIHFSLCTSNHIKIWRKSTYNGFLCVFLLYISLWKLNSSLSVSEISQERSRIWNCLWNASLLFSALLMGGGKVHSVRVWQLFKWKWPRRIRNSTEDLHGKLFISTICLSVLPGFFKSGSSNWQIYYCPCCGWTRPQVILLWGRRLDWHL